MRRLGIVTGSKFEAATLAEAAEACDGIIVCSGANVDRAHELARRLVADGCDALASVGTAGGLDMTVATGVVVVGEAILAPDGTQFPTDTPWRMALSLALTAAGTAYILGSVRGCDAPVTDIAAKRCLFDATGAACCDMESHAVAAVAAEARVPVVAVRVIADAADVSLPSSALSSIGPDGGLRIGGLLGALLRRPSDLTGMVGLALASRKALRSLRRVASLRAPLLALP